MHFADCNDDDDGDIERERESCSGVQDTFVGV